MSVTSKRLRSPAGVWLFFSANSLFSRQYQEASRLFCRYQTDMPSVLADFVAHVSVEQTEWEHPTKARILLNEAQLVIAKSEDDKIILAHDQIFDITLDTLPPFVDPLPGTPVTVAYEQQGRRTTAVIAAPERTAHKFQTVLFKAILNGTYTKLKHPEKVGGRVLNTDFCAGLLSLETDCVKIDTEEGPVIISLDSVIDFSREQRPIDGTDRPAIVVSHMNDGEAMTTAAAVESARKLSLLGRYLRQQYQPLLDSLRQLTLSEQETEALTTIYTVGDTEVSLPSVLQTDPKRAKQLLQALHSKALIESGQHGPVLTAKGQIVVNEYLERVNE